MKWSTLKVSAGWSLLHRDYAAWRWWPVFQCAVWLDRILVFAPFLDNGLCFSQTIEEFSIQ